MPTAPPANTVSSVLVVDDDEGSRVVIEAALSEDPDHRVTTVTSGGEALNLLAAQPFDLILCDVMMPVLDGLEVCRRAKAHPVWRYIPFILLTALDSSEDTVRGLDAGADDFLSKPIARVVLRARVKAMLRMRAHYQPQVAPTDVEGLLRRRRQTLIEAANLSPRELQVLELILVGRTFADVGAALGISARTAKFHQANLLTKLGAESRIDLLRLFL
ncbi:MAG: response regulator [Deltaproteobacteria bacterium]|nr:response regulator [Deltaproteobacteria bacterium]